MRGIRRKNSSLQDSPSRERRLVQGCFQNRDIPHSRSPSAGTRIPLVGYEIAYHLCLQRKKTKQATERQSEASWPVTVRRSALCHALRRRRAPGS